MIKPFQGRVAWADGRRGTDARVPITDETQLFTDLSVRLTGFDAADLEATGLTEVYREVAAEQLGAERYARMLRGLREPDEAGDGGELRGPGEAVEGGELRGPDEAIEGCDLQGPADAMGDGELREATRSVTYLWYTGSWPGSPPIVVSSHASAEALVWKAAGLKAPATAPGGYGSWAEAPGPSGPGHGGERGHR